MQVPVLAHAKIKGWPKSDKGGRAAYMTLAGALGGSFKTDAHFAAYSVPAIERRLTLDVLRDPVVRAASVPDGVPMVTAVFDVDCALAHTVEGGKGHVEASDAWWLAELAKVAQLTAEHPGAFVYRTRGGYRIVYALPEPFVMRDSTDAAKWSEMYTQWLAYLRRAFAISADVACRDWTRLFRLPHATRLEGGSPEERDTLGDVAAVGVWQCIPTAEDVTSAPALKGMRMKAANKLRRKPLPETEHAYAGDGVLVHAFGARGELGPQLEPGKWAVTCPSEAQHTKGDRFDGSTVLYAPRAGSELGWVHCSHAHCTGLDLRDVVAHFTDAEMATARDAAGLQPVTSTPERSPYLVANEMRREVFLHNEEHAINDEVLDALSTLPQLFHRGGMLVDIVRDATGAPRIREMPLARLRELVARVVNFRNFDENESRDKDEEAHPPDWCVRAIHSRGVWPGLRELAGVTETPVLRPDGSVLQEAGYDASTGLLYLPKDPIPEIPEAPTLLECVKASQVLCEPFCDFPFAGEAHRAAAVSIVLSIVGRPAFEGPSPLKAIDATSPGTGKSLLADVCAFIATGRTVAKMPHSPDEEETRKAITSIVLDGAPISIIDNVVHSLGSAALDNALTSTDWRDRLLGRTQMVSLPMRVEWIATGNNLAFVGDTFRRVLPIRLESPYENPERRENFVHDDLRAFVRRERPRLVAAALTILRGYIVAGRPLQEGVKRWGSFEGWSSLIAPAAVWAGLANPMGTRADLEEVADVRKSALLGILEGWTRIANDRAVTAAVILETLYPPYSLGPQPPVPPHVVEMRAAIESVLPTPPGKTPTAQRLGKLLGSFRGRVCGGRKFESVNIKNTQHWRVVHLVGGGANGCGGNVPTLRGKVENDHIHVCA